MPLPSTYVIPTYGRILALFGALFYVILHCCYDYFLSWPPSLQLYLPPENRQIKQN
ncbi:hypothetical protein AYX98_004331 [Salmonella enterica subsp. enterica serovar Buzu]|nr:hypothetical protein [Salmonella enterica subsp. enterica serovar Buzu]EDR5664119.1 hypothetical protein [Salmonella enterica]EDT7666181.1 hypothetical protein [Salmonella enterica subsp. enterica serovar Waycross]EDV1156472.1 hypothetical protein [Salmonella enterica subsp. enterica]EDW4419475.1 hypothetical protein [Salmonella enterica subsp. enterica serovar Java]EGI5663510.1 hypothetical protein [Salmonella enterica subsp. enterica serovar Mississippi]